MPAPDLPTLKLPGARFRRVLDRAAIVLLLAAASCYWLVYTPASASTMGHPLWLIVDVSRSMKSGTPSRLELARAGIASWLDQHGTRLPRPAGLIVFAAHARVIVAPTTDTRLVASQIARIHLLAELPDVGPIQGDLSGTNLACGLLLAQEWSAGTPATTWLFSDGDDPVGLSPTASDPLASRAWMMGLADESHQVPGTNPPMMSHPKPDLVKAFTVSGMTTIVGDRLPLLPMLSAPSALTTHQSLPSWLALLAVLALLISAIPQRLVPVVLLGMAGCVHQADERAARSGRVLMEHARQLPALERAPMLRAAEAELRASMRLPDRITNDRLHDLVVCLLDQASCEPPDYQAAGLAAEIAIMLPPDLGSPLRARARWLASLAPLPEHQESGSDGIPDANGTYGADEPNQSNQPPPAGTGINGSHELPGAGRLPVVADSAIPQPLTQSEAMRLLAAAARRLTPPPAPQRTKAPQGVPDW